MSAFVREAVRDAIARSDAGLAETEERLARTLDRQDKKLSQIYNGMGALFGLFVSTNQIDPNSPEAEQAFSLFAEKWERIKPHDDLESIQPVSSEAQHGSEGGAEGEGPPEPLPENAVYFG